MTGDPRRNPHRSPRDRPAGIGPPRRRTAAAAHATAPPARATLKPHRSRPVPRQPPGIEPPRRPHRDRTTSLPRPSRRCRATTKTAPPTGLPPAAPASGTVIGPVTGIDRRRRGSVAGAPPDVNLIGLYRRPEQRFRGWPVGHLFAESNQRHRTAGWSHQAIFCPKRWGLHRSPERTGGSAETTWRWPSRPDDAPASRLRGARARS